MCGLAVDQASRGGGAPERGIVELRLAAAEAHLRQPRAGADEDWERARAYLE